MINLSYSRISLADIADKLQLGSPEDAEFIVAKVTYVAMFVTQSKLNVPCRLSFVFSRVVVSFHH